MHLSARAPRARRIVGAALTVMALAVFVSPRAARAQTKTDPLLARLPMGANSIVVADVEKFLSSPLSQHEGWDEHGAGTAPKSASPLPSRPGLKRIYMAADLDLV